MIATERYMLQLDMVLKNFVNNLSPQREKGKERKGKWVIDRYKKHIVVNHDTLKQIQDEAVQKIRDDLEFLFQETKGQVDDWQKFGLAVFKYLSPQQREKDGDTK